MSHTFAILHVQHMKDQNSWPVEVMVEFLCQKRSNFLNCAKCLEAHFRSDREFDIYLCEHNSWELLLSVS